ncbi:unnamed protein product [Miscanthus lutarioriparius]|uniref:Uncharacterized protein n=1 Tax=Miscanthus lutarioriparius TaxID=422564 RepID=A0A811R4E8_9POAL|nr:unnamed protein product [Miscanthus lutarioriparius]
MVQNGTYLRNRSGVWEVGDHVFDHVFDGYATHRQIESDAYKAARAHGRPLMREFSQLCPSEPGTVVNRLRHAVRLASGAAMSDNANTTVLPLGDDRVVCLADVTKSLVLIDPYSLGTGGKLRYVDSLWMPAGSNRRQVIGRVRCRGGTMAPACVHSFAVTEKYIVVPEMPLRYSVTRMLMSERTPLYILDWLPDSGSYMHVACKSTRRTNGTYLRNGPGVSVRSRLRRLRHIGPRLLPQGARGRATGAHRQIESDAYKAAMAHGRPLMREFSQLCPSEPGTLVDRLHHVIRHVSGAATSDNANTVVLPLGDGRVVCLADVTKSSVLIDAETLGTVGKSRYTDKLWCPLKCTHPVVTRGGAEVLTLLPDFTRRGYLLARMTAGSNRREIHWKHGGERRGASFRGISLHQRIRGERRRRCPGQRRDRRLCEYYADPAIIQALALHKLRSPETAKDFPDSRVARFRIPLDGSAMGELETVLDPDEHGRGVESSTINPAYVGKEYRYLYACTARRPCNFFNALTKMDLVEKEARSWHEEDMVPSEPFFVARPGATNEDGGVVISTVSTMDGDGYVLLLDAATYKEIARLRLPYGLPFGFHGCWIPDKN